MKSLKFLFLVLLGTAGVTAALAVFAAACAHADPAAQAAASADTGWSLVETYGPVWGGMALAFGLASAFLRRNETTHWIAQGRALAVILAIVGTGTAALTAHFAGTPWSGVLVTAVVALFKLVQPSMTSVPPNRNREVSPAVGAVLGAVIGVVLLQIFVVLQPACGARQRATAATEAFIDCQGSDLATAVSELVPLAEQALLVAIGGTGHIDTGQLKAIAAPLKSNLGRCALAAAIAALATPTAETPGAPAAARLTVDGPALKGAFSAVRGELGWPAARLAGGEVL